MFCFHSKFTPLQIKGYCCWHICACFMMIWVLTLSVVNCPCDDCFFFCIYLLVFLGHHACIGFKIPCTTLYKNNNNNNKKKNTQQNTVFLELTSVVSAKGQWCSWRKVLRHRVPMVLIYFDRRHCGTIMRWFESEMPWLQKKKKKKIRKQRTDSAAVPAFPMFSDIGNAQHSRACAVDS